MWGTTFRCRKFIHPAVQDTELHHDRENQPEKIITDAMIEEYGIQEPDQPKR
jgi:hypothetical protein